MFFPKTLAGEPSPREPEANALRRSANDSVLKLDALSTGLASDYGNDDFLRPFLRVTPNIVVCELQSARTDDVVVLQTAYFAPTLLAFAPTWCRIA
jgi:hypothetical protein